MSETDFAELGEPHLNQYGWYVTTLIGYPRYLYSDLSLHESTGNNTSDVWPGYYPTRESANQFRSKYYAKFAGVQTNPQDAYDRAMEGI